MSPQFCYQIAFVCLLSSFSCRQILNDRLCQQITVLITYIYFIYSSHRPVVEEPATHVDLKNILVRPVNFESELQQMSIFTQKILSLIF